MSYNLVEDQVFYVTLINNKDFPLSFLLFLEMEESIVCGQERECWVTNGCSGSVMCVCAQRDCGMCSEETKMCVNVNMQKDKLWLCFKT